MSCYHGAHNSRKVPQTHPLVWCGKPCLRANDFPLSRQRLWRGAVGELLPWCPQFSQGPSNSPSRVVWEALPQSQGLLPLQTMVMERSWENGWVSCYHGAHNSRKVPQTYSLASGHAPCHSGNELGPREGNLHLGGIYGETQELELP